MRTSVSGKCRSRKCWQPESCTHTVGMPSCTHCAGSVVAFQTSKAGFCGIPRNDDLFTPFQISGGSVVPFGLENENKLLTTLNALEVSSAFTSFWRFKSIVSDAARNSATVTLVCIRQPDRHGKMGSLVRATPCTSQHGSMQAQCLNNTHAWDTGSCYAHLSCLRFDTSWS